MAVQGDVGCKEEIKTQFSTVEGVYKVVPLAELSRPNRLAYNNTGNTGTSPPVRVSLVCLPESSASVNSLNEDRTKISFNYGRELYVYSYRGIRKAVELSKPIDKRSFCKEEMPTSHDFNRVTAGAERSGVSLLVGHLSGQVCLLDPVTKEISKVYNSGDVSIFFDTALISIFVCVDVLTSKRFVFQRLIDRSKVTCVRWVPGSVNQFLCSHQSGNMYLYNEELSCSVDRPHYQVFKQGDGYSVYTCKTKTTRNPLYKWSIGDSAVNEFAFSPCSKYLAVVSQDGFLRIFNYDTMDLLGSCRSYYGGLICVCWSPDGRYVVAGGEDDLLTIWSFNERRVVARGAGHKSWVTVVAFDPYTTLYGDMDSVDVYSSNSDSSHCFGNCNYNSNDRSSKRTAKQCNNIANTRPNSVVSDGLNATCYRLGSVGQDTLLCLWDLKDDFLCQSYYRPRSSTVVSSGAVAAKSITSKTQSASFNNSSTAETNASVITPNSMHNSTKINSSSNHIKDGGSGEVLSQNSSLSTNLITSKLASLNFGEKKSNSGNEKDHKRSLSLVGNRNSSSCRKDMKNSSSGEGCTAQSGFSSSISVRSNVGTPQCPRWDECPLIEPMLCKKISHERLSGLVFLEDCIITACQDGLINTWCRPGKQISVMPQHTSPTPSSAAMGGSIAAGGTVV